MNFDFSAQSNVFWLDGAVHVREYPALQEDIAIDVAIVGAGMAGLHCAWNLRSRGLRVAIFEGAQIGRQATGRATAKVTSQHGLCYQTITKKFSAEYARIHARENEKALRLIKEISGTIGTAAAFETCEAYIFGRSSDEVDQLRHEEEAARAAGIDASIVHEIIAPVEATAALRFPGQGQFDPYGYLQGLAALLDGEVNIYENSRVVNVEYDAPCRLTVNGHEVTAAHVVVTTQQPIVGEGHFFAKAFPFAHVVAAAPLPPSIELDGMFINVGEPSRSIRKAQHEGETYVIVSGAEFHPGEPEDLRAATDDLRAFLADNLSIREPTHLWTNEDFRPMDGAAFIGPAQSDMPRLLVATGFAAWGITQGAVAGEVLASCVRGEEHTASKLYDATRHKPVAGGAEFAKENLKAGMHLVGDRVLGQKIVKLNEIGLGEAAVVSHGGESLAVRRDPSGEIVALSAICTHMGCVVDWNGVDRTWDCPCHGSRFDQGGNVLAGPATEPLERKTIHVEVDDGVVET